MSGIKILHLSDVHLGRKINNLPEDIADIRRSETIMSFENLLDVHGDSDVVLIAGDLFDGECNDETVRYFAKILEKHRNVRFFIACGNHDPYDSNAIKLLRTLVSENVTIFKEKIECCHIKELNACIYGVSFASSSSYTSLIRDFSVYDKSMINIMVMHGDVSANSRYNPITEQEISATNLDYLALGHIHKPTNILMSGTVKYAYAGVFEPQGFDEMYDCGAFYGTISKEKFELKFIDTSFRKYREINIDVSDFVSDEEVVSEIKKRINTKDIYKVVLKGNKKNFNPDINLISKLISGFYITFIDETITMDDILSCKDEFSLKGRVAFHLNKFKSEENVDKDVFDDACEILTFLFNKGSN